MKLGKPGLQGKFIIALLVAAALPFLAGLIAFETIGYRKFLAERGNRHQIEAAAVVRALDQASHAKGEELRTWLAADDTLIRTISARNRTGAGEDPTQAAADTKRIDEAWPTLPVNDPMLTAVTANPASRSLSRYQSLHPEIAEILATDNSGRLVAATGKTSDYGQSDEKWWQDGAALTKGGSLTDDLRFDSSSGVFSLDVIVPLRDEDQFAGVMKLSVDVTSLLSRLAFGNGSVSERCEILLPDGRILASSMQGSSSMSESVTDEDLETIRRAGNGWTVTTGRDGESWMTGFVAMGMDPKSPNGYIMFLSPKDEVVASLGRNFLAIGAAGAALLLICAAAGFHLVRHNILDPLAMLGAAARSISETARLGTPADGDLQSARAQQARAENEVGRIMSISTGDEIQTLAGDLSVMSSRVLRYHRELESEVTAKTARIREDLDLAREFQNALLPSRYPEVPPPGVETPLRLQFAHFYQPASTVGGDFFDFLVLNDDRTGILIADVMGHGARSALVTAILRALVRTHLDSASDPGRFLTELNRHLHEVVARSDQTMFVTAFFLVLDTSRGRATWAVAGHPPPLLTNRRSGGRPEPLWTGSQRQPALGLLPDASFRTSGAPLSEGDVFLLYTDGVIEAENPSAEHFGVERLAATFDRALQGPIPSVPARIIEEVSHFQRHAQYDDDVCMLVIEADAVDAIGSNRAGVEEAMHA